jgi:FtsH-binding integral membrane protein
MIRPLDPEARARQRLVRRATLYTYGFITAGLLIAAGGAALVAWMLSRAGQPFVRTWIIVTVVVVLPGMIATLWKVLRQR